MTTTIAFAATTDGYVTSYSPDYTTARNGGGTFYVNSTSAEVVAGQQNFAADGYGITQAFMRFAYTLPAGEQATTAAFRVHVNSTSDGATDRALEFRSYDWGAAVDAADFRTSAALPGLTLLAQVTQAQGTPGSHVMAGGTALMSAVAGASGTVSVVVNSSTARIGTAPRPNSEQQHYMASSDEAGTTNDPCLILSSVRRSTLFGVRNASVRLSDGTWCVLESDGAAVPAITLKRHTGTAATTIATLGTEYAAPRGAQAFSLAVDASDNLYVVGGSAASITSIAAQAFVKGSGWTWTAQPVQVAPAGSSAAPINQTAATWTAVNGGSGVLLAAVSFSADAYGGSGTIRHMALSAATLLAGSGTLSLSIANSPGAILPNESTPAPYSRTFANEVGAGLDVVAAPTAGVGYAASFGAGAAPGDAGPVGAGRWTVTEAGAVSGVTVSTPVRPYKDAAGRVRVVATGGSTVAVVAVDPASGWGLTVQPYQATASGWTALSAPIRLDPEGITGMPSPAALAALPVWDAVWSDFDNMLILYFRDSAAFRTIRRTRVNLTTYQPVRDSVLVAAVPEPSGGNHLAYRVATNRAAGAAVLITAAALASDGLTLSTSYVLDAYNSPPTTPTLQPRPNYDAAIGATFSWIFNDPNLPTGDLQSAYQLQIVNADTGVTVLDTGKVISGNSGRVVAGGTLSNGVNYQWRVMLWDGVDAASPWSPYGTFSTSAGGSTSITNPATDNPPNAASATVSVTWAVTGTTQAKYHLWATRNDTGVIVGDTGWVTSTATTASVGGLVSGVTHTLRAQVESGAGVRSAIGTRLITPVFVYPDAPLVAVSSETDGGYLLVSITNPAPTGDRPSVVTNQVYRRRAGETQWGGYIGTTANSTPFRDYTAGAGVAYEYMVRGVSATGLSWDSAPASGSLWLEGVWLHDSADPQGTAVHFRYGKAARSGSLDVAQQATYYAGRTFPVVDFGAQENEQLTVRVEIPFGPTYLDDLGALRSLARSRTARVFRDNRGRVLTGTLSELRDQDTDTGSSATFQVTRVEV